MKSSIKKSKKIIILSVVLFALFCCNAFKSAHFSPAPRVSAESENRALNFYYLEDLGINNTYSNYAAETPLKWSAFQVLGQNGIVEEKTVSYLEPNDIKLKNYYNQISGSGGEFVALTKNSVLEFNFSNNEFICIIDFYDRVNQTVNYILTFFSGLSTTEIEFKDITINGQGLPENSTSENLTRFRFNGIQIYWIDSGESGFPYARNKQLQPTFIQFFTAANNGVYSKREYAIITFANAYIDGYRPTAGTTFKFNKIYAQISQIAWSADNNAIPIQQPTMAWTGENGENLYYLDYTANSIEAAYYIYNAGENNLKVDTDGKLYTFTNDVSNLTELSESNYTGYLTGKISDNNTDFLKIKLSPTDSNYINLLNKRNQTGEQSATDFLNSFKLKIKIDTYEEEPEPEPEPEPEKPKTTNEWEDFGEDISDLIKVKLTGPDKTWLVAIVFATALFGIGGFVAAGTGLGAEAIHEAGGADRFFDILGADEAVKSIPQKIGEFIAESTKIIINTIGAILREFFDGLGLLEPLQKFGSIALMIFGILVSSYLLGLFIISRKNS